MASAVTRLSPVTMTVRMPIARSSAKRSLMPSLTTSLRCTTPRMRTAPERSRAATTRGVPPVRETPSTSASSCSEPEPAQAAIAPAAPLRTCDPSGRSSPLIRVCAVKGTISAPRGSSGEDPASARIDCPSGVASASEVSAAKRVSSSAATPSTVRNSLARRLP